MGRCLLSSTISTSRILKNPNSIQPYFSANSPATPSRCFLPHQYPLSATTATQSLKRINPSSTVICSTTSSSADAALLSEVPKFFKIGAESTGSIPSNQLLQIVENAAKTGSETAIITGRSGQLDSLRLETYMPKLLTFSSSQDGDQVISFPSVVMDAVNKPRNVTYKGLTDLVTDTDKMSEAAILKVVRDNFPDHLILGEEGGLIGDSSSDYLWCIDPLDGTTNFAHGYPSFAVSVGVLFRGKPAAASVVEFVGGPMCWNTRTFSAVAGGGAFCNGQKIHVSQTDKVERSLLVTGFGYDHDDAWATNINLFKEFTDVSRGVRRLGAAAVDMCHVALGIVEAYWEYRLKPWDMAAGVLIVEEAGGTVSCMDGGKFSVFDRSVLVSNGVLHAKLLEKIGPATEDLKSKGIEFSLWYKPENYCTEL